VEVTADAIVVELAIVVATAPVIVVVVSPVIVDEGITPVTKESSVTLEGIHAPGPVGASPSADAMDETRTCRPASVG